MTELAVAVPVSTLWTAPDAPRAVDAPAVSATPDMTAWFAAMSPDCRLGLHGRTVSQLLLGEPVEVMEDAGDWVRVTAPWQPSSAGLPACSAFAGYPGWLPASHLATAAESAHDQALAVVTEGTARLRVATGKTVTVSWATTFPVIAVRDIAVHVALPEGRRGVLGVEHVALRPSGAAPAVAADAILALARRMVATGYLWGGTSGWGLDCSGLVHLAFRAAGLVVPRDAHDQQAAATAVAIDDTRPGDLYFFGPVGRASHVGLVSGRRTMLHAPETGQLVEEAPVNAERSLAITGAGRFGLSDETGRVRMR